MGKSNYLLKLRRRLGPIRRTGTAYVSELGLRAAGPKVYFGISGDFVGEQKAVASGRKLHRNAVLSHTGQMFLRRSIHRIEKGLSQPSLRQSFATDYIMPATRTAITNESSGADPGELKWVRDVLDDYFRATASSQRAEILRARELWTSRGQQVPALSSDNQLKPFPYRSWTNVAAFDVVKEVAAHRRSVRWFESKPVERADVMAAVEVGLMGPSACNRQSFRFLLLEDEDLRAKVASVPMGTAGFADQIPLLGVIVGQHRGYEHQRDRHAIFVDGGLFAAGFVVALEAKGLSSCCINWPELEAKNVAIKQLLELHEDERVVMLIAIGHAQDGQLVPRSHKRSVESVAEWL